MTDSEQRLRDAFVKAVQRYWSDPDIQDLTVWQWLAIRVDRAAQIGCSAAVHAALKGMILDEDRTKKLIEHGVDAFITALEDDAHD